MFLPEQFRFYLTTQGFPPVTVKNYVADLNHFLGWLAQTTGVKHQVAEAAVFSLITQETIEEYKSLQSASNIPLSTINRRLSTLRKFSQFGISHGWLKDNWAQKVGNITSSQVENAPLLDKFCKDLEKEKTSPVTIKNYLSDLRHFISWVEAN